MLWNEILYCLGSEFCFEDKNKFQCMEVDCVNQTLLDQSQRGQ